MADEVLRERRGNIEILAINRPEARNAINGVRELGHVRLMDGWVTTTRAGWW